MPLRSHSESALRISDCVTELLRKQPFFGSLVLRLPLRPDSTRETLATDGYEIRYSPQWIANTDSHVIETAMARVVMACALKHHTRRNDSPLRCKAKTFAHSRAESLAQLVIAFPDPRSAGFRDAPSERLPRPRDEISALNADSVKEVLEPMPCSSPTPAAAIQRRRLHDSLTTTAEAWDEISVANRPTTASPPPTRGQRRRTLALPGIP